MRDYDPTTGRDIQPDRLGLVDGVSVYGYAGQNPKRYIDPEGRCIQFGPLAPVCVAAVGAAVKVAVGILLHFCIGDGCYTWDELARDAAFGAAGGPISLYGRVGAADAAAGVTKGGPLVNAGKQGKHIPGSNNYIPGRSVVTADPQALAQRARTGVPLNSLPRGQPGFKERVDF